MMSPHPSRYWPANYTCATGLRIIYPRLRWLYRKYCRVAVNCEINKGIGLIPDPVSTGKLVQAKPRRNYPAGSESEPVEAIRTRLSMETFIDRHIDRDRPRRVRRYLHDG